MVTVEETEPPPPPPAPTVDLKVNGSNGPLTLEIDEDEVEVTLSWGSTEATTLTASATSMGTTKPAWSGSKPLSGTATVSLAIGTHTLRLTATGPGGSDLDEVVVTVEETEPPPPPPVVVIVKPLDGQSFVRSGSPATVTASFQFEVEGGEAPFKFRVKFPDEHLQRELVTSSRGWEISKTFSNPGTGAVAVEVEDGTGKISNRDTIVITIN